MFQYPIYAIYGFVRFADDLVGQSTQSEVAVAIGRANASGGAGAIAGAGAGAGVWSAGIDH